MHIYLIDKNINTINAWSQYFSENPDFGGGCGDVSPETIAYMMHQAYNQVMNPPTEITWNYAERCYPEFYEDLLR